MKKNCRSIHVWWIDDEPARVSDLIQQAITDPSDVSKAKKLHAEFDMIDVGTAKSAADEVLSRLSRAQQDRRMPTLLVVDQMLCRTADNLPMAKGSSLAVVLREKYPNIPLVGVTAAHLCDIANFQKQQFVEFFSRDEIQPNARVSDLYAISDGFYALVQLQKQLGNIRDYSAELLKLLDCPREDADVLLQCIPGEFRNKWDVETPHSFARWIWHTLLDRPGFLNDDLGIATRLGLSEEGLRTVSEKISPCEYRGIFASQSRRRWWVSKVCNEVRKLVKASPIEPLSVSGRSMLRSNKKKLLSVCYGKAGGKDIPNAVAFSDGTLRKRVQARIEDTIVLVSDSPPVGFEQLRVCVGR